MVSCELYRQAFLLYRNLLRTMAGCPSLLPGQVKTRAQELVGQALPDLRRRDAGRLAQALPWSAEEIRRACRGPRLDCRIDVRLCRNRGTIAQAMLGQVSSDSRWLLWDLLEDGTRSAILLAWPDLASPGSNGYHWEQEEEIDHIMRQPVGDKLARVLAGEGESIGRE